MGHEMVKSCLGAYRHAVDPSLPESDEAALSSKTCTRMLLFWVGLDDVILHDQRISKTFMPIIANHRQSSGPSMGLMPRYSLSKASCYLACLTVM